MPDQKNERRPRDEAMPSTLQEMLLALLVFGAGGGSVVAGIVRADHFDGVYHDVAAVALDYRARYGAAPGRAHVEDLLLVRQPRGGSERARRILRQLEAHAGEVHPDYAAKRAREHVRRAAIRTALVEAGERYSGPQDGSVDDMEAILRRALSERADDGDAGTFLSDTTRGLAFLDRAESGPFFALGIPVLDRMRVGMTPGEMILYVAAKGCLVGGTLIDCPRDLSKYPLGIPIRELVGKQFLTYSWDADLNRPCLSKVLDVWKVGRERVYKVRLSTKSRQNMGNRNGGARRAKYLPPLELVGTFDHPVMLSNGTWRKLGDLRLGDSLKSMYRRASSKPNYCWLSWSSSLIKTDVAEHRFVCEEIFGASTDSVHHKDHNRINNSPDNLCWINASDHASYHLGVSNKKGESGWKVTGVHPRGMSGKRHSIYAKERMKTAAIELSKKRARSSSGRFAPNHEVVSVDYAGVREVFDMNVEGTNNFVANGVFVHNSGKSWFAVHCGRQAAVQGARVVHVSLEMDEDRVAQRYYMTFLGIAMRRDKYPMTTLELDELERAIGYKTRPVSPRAAFADPRIRDWIRQRIKPWGTRLGRIVIKRFPTGQLTVDGLRGYLDYLEQVRKFVPQVLIVDYPDLMRLSTRDLRVDTGRTYVNLRGLAVERAVALVAPTQGNRASLDASTVRASMVAEDKTKLDTSDTVLLYSQTRSERKRGLARLRLEYSRDSERGHVIVMTQSYPTGQYVVRSALQTGTYWDAVRAGGGEDGEE